MIKEALAKVTERIDLTEAEAEEVMREIMEGQATQAQIAAYITGLRMKGETVGEITGSARIMREKATKVRINDRLAVDTCGTGGDKLNTFNISTTAAFVVAGAGVTVAKHGNRSVSSRSGSADVLKALGVNIDVPKEKVEDCLNTIGIGFLFAPLYHSAMKYAIGPRKEIGIRTLFNILGPLTNPAGTLAQVLGVYDRDLSDIMAQVLINLGSLHCFCVCGMDGLDEVTITGKTKVCEGKEGKVKCYYIEPKDFGISTGKLKDIVGGSAEDNSRITLDVLGGQKGPRRDVVLLNAAPALVAAGKAETLQDAVTLAASTIDDGAALEKLKQLREMTNQS
ncbi:MAG TPA: anthranilate phosphoribosyltransferase [Nitrospiria bacterium]